MGTAPQDGVKRLLVDGAEVVVFPAATQLFEGAADEFFRVIYDSIKRGEVCRIALSGGSTPKALYSLIADRVDKGQARGIDWARVSLFFGDERCVPPDSEQSNYRMAKETFFDPANVPENCILRMRGEIDPPTAALEYQDALDRRAKDRNEQIFRHDLILLGLGDDGHTASLFPGTDALNETDRRVVANFVPKLESWRLTFTFPMINAARHVCFLIAANKNPELVERVLGGDSQYPATRVNPSNGDVTWIIGE